MIIKMVKSTRFTQFCGIYCDRSPVVPYLVVSDVSYIYYFHRLARVTQLLQKSMAPYKRIKTAVGTRKLFLR